MQTPHRKAPVFLFPIRKFKDSGTSTYTLLYITMYNNV